MNTGSPDRRVQRHV